MNAKILYWKGGEIVTDDFYEPYIKRYNNMVYEMLAPIRKFADEYMQQLNQIQQTINKEIQQALERTNAIMRLYRERLEEYREYLKEITVYHREAPPSYDLVIDIDMPESLEIDDAPSRSPPDDSILVKVQVWFLILLPVVLQGLLYCEELVLGEYLLRVIKSLLELFGVYL